MPSHGLGGTDRNFLSKQISNGVRFQRVADGSRSPVSVKVADNTWIEFRVAQRVAHDAETTFMLGRRLRHVISVSAHPVANQLRQNRSAAPPGMFQLLKNQNASAFTHHEA